MFGCEKKLRREKVVRKRDRREKKMRNRVDLAYCLVQEKEERNRRERDATIF
jgi:hypothetical protein